MDQQTRDFGSFLLEGVFKCSDDLVDPRHGQLIGERAVAVYLDAVVLAGDHDIMDIQDLGEERGGIAEGVAEDAGTLEGGGTFDGGGFGLDVGEDGSDFGNFGADAGFQTGHEIVRGAQ